MRNDQTQENTPRAARWIRLALCVAVVLVWGVSDAQAGGTVIKLDGDKAYVDLGADDGVGAGSELTLMHVIVARDPVTKRKLRDRFALGRLTVIKSGARVAVAQVPSKIRHRIRVGDEVELASAPRKFKDPWQRQLEDRRARRRARTEKPKPVDPAAVQRARDQAIKQARDQAVAQANRVVESADAVRATWKQTLGKPPEERVGLWKIFLQENAASPYAQEIIREIESLESQIRQQAKLAAARSSEEPAGDLIEMRVARLSALDAQLNVSKPLAVSAPSEVYEGSEVALAFAVLAPEVVSRGWMYFRHAGDTSFRRTELRGGGDAYVRATIPPDAVQPPGIEYFIEAADASPDSKPIAVFGSQTAPQRIPVVAAVEEAPADIKDRSRVTLFVDYVDFDGFDSEFDQYVHAEVDFMYRFRKPIYALRVGFGTLSGFGGPKDVIDEAPGDDCVDPADDRYKCSRVTFTYAYVELEHRFSPLFAVMLRPQFGTGTSDNQADTDAGRCNTDDTNDCDLFSALGLRARVRIGDERATNLTLGVGLTQSVGTIFEAAYTWSVIPRFPVKLAAQVTDQPVREDFGVRLIADIGWRSVRWIYPSVRIAYQARDVDHAGISGGAAVNLDW